MAVRRVAYGGIVSGAMAAATDPRAELLDEYRELAQSIANQRISILATACPRACDDAWLLRTLAALRTKTLRARSAI
jgi:hypothetical protein